MNNRQRNIAMAAVVVTGVATLVVVGLDGPIDRPTSGPAAEVPVVAHTWTDGAVQSYRLDIDSNVHLSVPEFKFDRRLVQQVDGTLHMRVLDVGDRYVQVGFQFEPQAYLLDGRRSAAMEEHIAAPFLVTFEANGRPLTFEFKTDIAKDARILLEEALRLFQVVIPQPGEPAWTTEEDHATGRYLASYRVSPDGRVHKNKDAYKTVHVRLPSNRATDPQVNLQQSEVSFALSAESSWLRDANFAERLTVVQDGIQISESSVQATLTLLPGVPAAAEVALFEAAGWAEVLDTYAAAHGEDDQRLVEAEPGIDPLVQMGTFIDKLQNGDEGRIATIRGLAALIAAHAEMADQVLAQIRQAGTSGKTDALLVQALQLGGTREAQDALARLMNDTSHMHINRTRAALALGAIEKPTDQTLAMLNDMSRQRGDRSADLLSNTSILAMGSISRTLRDTDPARAQAISNDLALRLNQARNDHEATVTLKAIANTRDAGMINSVAPYLADESHRVRAAAADTLGVLGAEGTAAGMTAQLRTEPSGTVRAAIVQSLDSFNTLPPDVLSLVNSIIVNEPSADARYHMTRLLVHNLDNYPAAEATLTNLAMNDSSNRIRKLSWGTLTHRRQALRGQGG